MSKIANKIKNLTKMQYSIWLDNNKFTYELLDNSVVDAWAEFIKASAVNDLRPSLDPWHGNSLYFLKIKEFNQIIKKINQWIPNKIDYFDVLNPEASLNSLHIHFPKQERIEQDPDRLEDLTVFNDLLHQIDLGIKSKGQRLFLLLFPDNGNRRPLDDSEYSLFQPGWLFGDLMLHYPHVGRHPFEIFTTNDVDCPGDQIVCQHDISAAHTLRFFDAVVDKEQFNNFYTSSNISWPYTLQDPKLSFGYIKLGNLISVNNQQLNKKQILDKVKNSRKITNWKIH